MNIVTKHPVTLLITVLLSPLTHANSELENKLTFCSKLKVAQKRLACYDRTMSSFLEKQSPLAVTKETKSNNEEITKESLNSVLKNNQDKLESSVKQDLTEEEKFGQPTKEDQIEAINSHIIGKFKGWKKGTRLKLANGQVWKVVSSGKVYSNQEAPKIRIFRAIFGSYTAKVTGVTPVAKVRRVK